MENKQQEREYEEKRLKRTISLAEEQLKQAKWAAEKKKAEIVEAKREVGENAAHSITGLYTSDGFEALVELSQYCNPVTDKIVDYEEEEHKIFLLENIIKSPYFARIDFKFGDEEEFEKIYIGRSSLREKTCQEMYVYDWRSPIASVFYRFMKGGAFYDAPCGRVDGELKLKRQYEIKDGKLEYFFDTDVQIVDEFLRQLLSQNTTAKMKAIVETIQKEQDVVIRDMENDLLMVQGVAGSGKTSIALHRTAYLMYQGLRTKLSANNIVIISPNELFEQYISNVLPELGEDNVVSVLFDDLLDTILKGRKIQLRNSFLESIIADSPYKGLYKNSIELKTSEFFKEALDQFLHDMPDGSTKIDVVELYKALFKDEGYFCGLLKNHTDPENVKRVWKYTKENLEADCLAFDDAIAIAYLFLKIYGVHKYKNIRQVVIDEAQDYYPLQYGIFRLLFADAKFTILGDMEQTLAKKEDLSIYRKIQKILNKKKSSLIMLNKSFRCTNEILNFSLRFIGHDPQIKSFNREGDRPEIFIADDLETYADEIVKEVKSCQERGWQSIGLICKTEKNAVRLFDILKHKLDIQLIIGNKNVSDLKGVFIIPIYMSKGLEFDAVLICDADNKNYHGEDGKNLLYVACSRALHRLSLFCEKEVSMLI